MEARSVINSYTFLYISKNFYYFYYLFLLAGTPTRAAACMARVTVLGQPVWPLEATRLATRSSNSS
jgi:hypothetical protein